MARNKVVINGETYIDLTDTTATADKILQGYGAYGADGEWIDGSVRGRTFAITNNSTAGSIMVHYTLANNITSSSGQINNSTGSVAVGATKTYMIPFMTVYIEFSKGAAATNTNFKLLVDGVEKAPEVEWGHKKLYSFSSTNISPSGTTILEFRDSEDPWPVDIVAEPLSVTSNGTYAAPSGTAYTPVTVAVPNSYEATDEGKVVSNGALVAQSSDTVTQNDTYDTTLINSLTVNVPGPTGTISIDNDGTYDVTNYASAEVDYDIFNHLRYVTFVNNTSKSLTLYVLTKMSNGRIANKTVILQSQASTSQYFLVGTSVFEIRSSISNGNYSISYTDSSSSGSATLVAERAFSATTWMKVIEFSATFSMADGVITFTDSSDPFPEEVITEPLSVTANGTYTAPSGTAYTPVTVNVPTPTPSLQTKSVLPSETAQTVTPDSGYDGLSQVSVGAISNTYVGSGIMRRSSSDLTASGAAVNVPAGYYASAASKAVASGTEGTPSAAKGTVSNHSVTVTPSVTNTAGYISGGTKTGTGVTVTASELVSGSETKASNGTYDVTNLASLVVAVPIVTYYTGSGAPSSSLGSNGDIYLQTS